MWQVLYYYLNNQSPFCNVESKSAEFQKDSSLKKLHVIDISGIHEDGVPESHHS